MQIKFDYYPAQCTLESLNFDHAGILQRSENIIHGVFNAIPGAVEAVELGWDKLDTFFFKPHTTMA